jgi:hypothetical protein
MKLKSKISLEVYMAIIVQAVFWVETLYNLMGKYILEEHGASIFKWCSVFLPTVSNGSEWSSFPYPLPWVQVSIFPAACLYITKPIPQPTHSSPEDGGSMFLQSVGIHLQDCMVS